MPEPNDPPDPTSPRPDRDPEFRSSGRPAPRGPNVLSAEHQRIVANPFLAAAGLLLWLAGLSWVNRASGFGGAGFVFVMLWALAPIRYLPRLIHYHCRDCGATGRLATWKAHACPTVIGRQRSGSRRRLRGPSPPTQVVIWAYVVLALAIAWNAFGGPTRPGLSLLFLLD